MSALDTQIDDELRSYLLAVDDYQTSAVELAACCKSGCFDIAKARKAMSCEGSSVSQLQYPAQMKARIGILVDEDSDAIFCLNRIDANVKACEENSEVYDEGNTRGSTDPLNWFGILVPIHLRNSQQTFIRGLQVL
jgi:hypothetical protein